MLKPPPGEIGVTINEGLGGASRIGCLDEPAIEQRGGEDDGPFGLYEGTPLTERTSFYGLTLPDKITIFRGPLERATATPSELYAEVQTTVIHEVAHHFGMDEDQIAELGWE